MSIQAPPNPWREAAEKSRAEGYLTGNRERMLLDNLRLAHPEKLAQLTEQGVIKDYLTAQATANLDLEMRLHDEGTPAETARELALAELLQPGADEQDKPEPWEIADGMDDATVATQQVLTGKNPPRTMPA